MKKSLCLLVSLAVLSLTATWATAASVSVVTKETVKNWMENGPVTILDARQGRDWKSSGFKIKGAHRADPGQLAAWKNKFHKGERIVLYCA